MKKNNTIAAFEFKPYSNKQIKLMTWWMPESPYKDYDIIIAAGAIRTGKTVASIDGFIMWSQSTFQNQNFIIAGKSMGALKRNVLKPLFQILTAKDIPYKYYRSEDPRIEIGTNTYYLFGANNESSQDTLQGLTAAGAYADEVALFPKSFVDQMIGRCSVENSKIWFNANPQGPYHYIKTEFIDKAEEKRVLHLHFDLDDNLTLSEKVKERYRRMFSGIFYQRYILGLWVMAEGIIYHMFDKKAHTKKRSEMPTEFDRKFICIDYGTNNPCVFLKYGVVGETYYELDEYYHDGREKGQKTDQEYAQDLIKFMDGDEYAIFVDPSAASFIAQLKRIPAYNIYKKVAKAVNKVLDGIQTVSAKFENDQLYINVKNVNSIKELTTYVWDDKAQLRGEDKVLKQNDHASDAKRYGIHTDGLLQKAKAKKARPSNNRKRIA